MSERTLLLWLGSIFEDDVLNALLVLFEEIGKGTIVRVLSVEWMILHPVAGGITIEISSWLDTQVHVGLVNARAQLVLLGESSCSS